ncbi:hypothetical protein [Streptomyces sp. NPDC003393]
MAMADQWKSHPDFSAATRAVRAVRDADTTGGTVIMKAFCFLMSGAVVVMLLLTPLVIRLRITS